MSEGIGSISATMVDVVLTPHAAMEQPYFPKHSVCMNSEVSA